MCAYNIMNIEDSLKMEINDFLNVVNNLKKEILELKEQLIQFKSQVTIILTTTVNVFSNIDCCVQPDKDERINTYLHAIRQWLEKTKLHIILVENSGYDFPELAAEKARYKHRFEVFSFKEDDLEEAGYLKDRRSKGDHELFAIQYAYKNSKFVNYSLFIIKVTGRYYIPGFEEYLKEVDINNYSVIMQHQIERCEMVGSNHKCFYQLFDLKLLNEDGNYEEMVEKVYKYRISCIKNAHHSRIFDIEPTQRGGVNEIFHNI